MCAHYRVHAAANKATGRRPKKSVIDGVRWAQARYIRVMHAHWRRIKGKSSPSECVDDITDAQLEAGLAALAEANDLDKNIDEECVDDITDAQPVEPDTEIPNAQESVDTEIPNAQESVVECTAAECRREIVEVSSDDAAEQDAMGW